MFNRITNNSVSVAIDRIVYASQVVHLQRLLNSLTRSWVDAVSGQVGDKSTRRHPSRRQVESATSNSATTAVNSATTAVKSATNALVKSATMIENGNNESLKLRYYYHHDGPNTLNCVFILLYL